MGRTRNYGTLGATTLFGGIGSAAFGGDFLAGAMTGMNIGLYNHCLHIDAEVNLPEVVVTGKAGSNSNHFGTYLMDILGLASTTFTTYAAPKYISNWNQPKYWTNSRGEWLSSKLLEERANGKYVLGYNGYKISHDMAAETTRIPRAIGTKLGYLSIFANGLSMFGNPSVGNAINLSRSIGSAANLGYALMDGYVTIELWNYDMFIKPRIENNIRQGLPWDFGTGLDRSWSSGSMP